MEILNHAGEQVADDDAHNQGDNQAGFGAETESPRNAHLGDLGGVGGDISVGADDVAADGDEVHDREGNDETEDIALHELNTHGQHNGHEDICADKSLPAFHVSFMGGLEALHGVPDPHAHFANPADKVDAPKIGHTKEENKTAYQAGDSILVETLRLVSHNQDPHSSKMLNHPPGSASRKSGDP